MLTTARRAVPAPERSASKASPDRALYRVRRQAHAARHLARRLSGISALGLHPGRTQIVVLEGLPPDADLEAMAPGRARKKAVRTEVASVAFAFRFTHFKGTHHPAGKLRSRILPALPTAYRPLVCGRGRRVFRIATPATRTDGRAELHVVFVENMYHPDPADEQYEMKVLYLIREHGRLRIETDDWTMGLFSLDTWRRVLGEAGSEVHEGRYSAAEEEYTVFACVKTR